MTETTDKQKAAKQRVDDMISKLRKGKEIHDQFAQAIQDRMLIQGKTMEGWRKDFEVAIPDDLDLVACKAIGMKLMALYQKASFMKAMAEAAHTLSKKGYDSEYRTKFEATVSEYRAQGMKLPAKDTLETLARTSVDDVEAGLAYSDLAVRFWKEILENLNYQRKVVENATINNSVEAKMTERHM